MRRFLGLATKHTVIFGIGDIAQKAVGFILLPLYMRCLSPEDYGVLAMLGIISMAFAGLVLQGLPTASFRAYSYDYGNDEGEQKDAVCTAYTYLLVVSFVVYLFLFVTAPFWSDVLFKEGEFTLFIRLVFVTEFFNCSSIIPFVILRARLLSAWVAGISLGRVLINTLLTVWFVVYLDMGVKGVLLSNMIVSGLVFFLSPLIPIIIHKSFPLRISWDKLRWMLAFGLPMIPGIFAGWIMSSADRCFLEYFSTREQLGLYAIGFKLASILAIVFINPFSKTWPAIFYPKANDGDAKKVFSQFATYFLLVGCMMSLAIICVSDHLIRIIGPEEYWAAYIVVPLLVTGILIHGFQRTVNLGLFVKNKTKYAPLIVIAGALSNIVFNAMLIPTFGMVGAATGTLLSYCVMLGMTHCINQRIYPIPYDYKRLLHLSVLFVAVVVVIYVVKIDSFWLLLPLRISFFLAFIMSLFLTRFFTDRELEVMKEYYARLSSMVFNQLI